MLVDFRECHTVAVQYSNIVLRNVHDDGLAANTEIWRELRLNRTGVHVSARNCDKFSDWILAELYTMEILEVVKQVLFANKLAIRIIRNIVFDVDVIIVVLFVSLVSTCSCTLGRFRN